MKNNMKMKLLIPVLCLILIGSVLLCPRILAANDGETGGSLVYLSDIPDRMTDARALTDASALINSMVSMDTSPQGDIIHIGLESFDKGIGMHCMGDNPTYAEFDISGYNMTLFHAWVGVQNVSSIGTFLEWGNMTFYIEADGEEIYRSPSVEYGDQPVEINVNITGVRTLRLCQDNNGTCACDLGVWGDAAICTETTIPSHTLTETEEVTVDENFVPRSDPDTLQNGYAYVSDLTWMAANSLAGTRVTRDGNINDGETIYSPDMIVYAKGVGMHTCDDNFGSYVELDISDYGFTKFASHIGMVITLSSSNITMADAVFAVYGDGQELYRSDLMEYMDPFAVVEVDVTGVETLRLAVSSGGNVAGDWCVWANALLSVSGEVEELFKPDGILIYDANGDPIDTDVQPEAAASEAPSVTEEPTQKEELTQKEEPTGQDEPISCEEPSDTDWQTSGGTTAQEVTAFDYGSTSGQPTGQDTSTETGGGTAGCRSALVSGTAGTVVLLLAGAAALRCRFKRKETDE